MIIQPAWDTSQQIINNLLHVVVAHKAADNPYLKAVLVPLIDTFLNGILQGIRPGEMAPSRGDETGRAANTGEAAFSQPDLSHFLEQATLAYPMTSFQT